MSEKIFEYRVANQNGQWQRKGKRLSFFTEQTVPKLHEWLKRGEDGVASYFCFENERPTPPLPLIDRELSEVYLTEAQSTLVAQSSGCGCKKPRSTGSNALPRTKTPTDDCWQCAEKHLGSAYDTYAKEHGYRELNRIHYIGALNDAENHLAGVSPKLAEDIRNFRHNIQDGVNKTDSEWQALSKRFYDSKDASQFAELLSKRFDKIYLFSNVDSTSTVPVTSNDLLVFINKAIPADKYANHPHRVCFHRSAKDEYGERRFDMPNRFVFGVNGISSTEIDQIKAGYDWDYTIEEGKVKSCSTGFMVAKHLIRHFTDSKLILVNFGLNVINSTYRCPWHNWEYESKELEQYPHVYTTEVV